MDAKTCIEKLRLCGVLNVATVDGDGLPQVRCISAVHYEGTNIYMLTSRGKNVAKEWEQDGHVQLLVHTRFNEMIRVSGKVEREPENEQALWRDKIYDAQSYLTNVYPGNTREINVIYALKDYTIEYFNLGVRPIDRFVYEVGSGKAKPKGYQITDACIGCGTCISECPEDAISEGNPYVINPIHCLHCGRCQELCPAQAIIRL
jgi:uncharacterized pyridoxamine 5'-phosphate oxidase family protein/Pyruvate/2-oxoacid:ferredoxin oxidoreductase delta subunit